MYSHNNPVSFNKPNFSIQLNQINKDKDSNLNKNRETPNIPKVDLSIKTKLPINISLLDNKREDKGDKEQKQKKEELSERSDKSTPMSTPKSSTRVPLLRTGDHLNSEEY